MPITKVALSALLLTFALLAMPVSSAAVGPQKGDTGYQAPMTQEEAERYYEQQRSNPSATASGPTREESAPTQSSGANNGTQAAPTPSLNKQIQYGEIIIHQE